MLNRACLVAHKAIVRFYEWQVGDTHMNCTFCHIAKEHFTLLLVTIRRWGRQMNNSQFWDRLSEIRFNENKKTWRPLEPHRVQLLNRKDTRYCGCAECGSDITWCWAPAGKRQPVAARFRSTRAQSSLQPGILSLTHTHTHTCTYQTDAPNLLI